jgi:hypothetical protein
VKVLDFGLAKSSTSPKQFESLDDSVSNLTGGLVPGPSLYVTRTASQ